jgi:hypothetical protein
MLAQHCVNELAFLRALATAFGAVSLAMQRCVIFYLRCVCGSRGSIVELCEAQLPAKALDHSRFSLRALSMDGGYAGANQLFARLKPACENCGRALAPGSLVAVSELGRLAVIAPAAGARFALDASIDRTALLLRSLAGEVPSSA